ncbi:MAG: hypothetical protein H6732_15170 [Alphaproteobacteria bacterium]|nr:hypothetical protein [Alphaproteobacteria bacterium]
MILLLSTLAWAAPPEGLDLDDYDPWVQAARAFDRGPDGCWVIEGELTLRLKLDSGASALGRARDSDQTVHGKVDARFVDHQWTRFHYTLDAPKRPWMLIRPFWGKVKEGAIVAVDDQDRPLKDEVEMPSFRRPRPRGGEEGDADGASRLQSTSVETLIWDDEAQAVVLREDAVFEGFGRGRVVSAHTFPGARPVATAFDLELPGTVTLGTWPLTGSVHDGEIHVRGFEVDAGVLPQAQRFSAIGSFFGTTAQVDSFVQFTRASRCEDPPADAPPAAPEPPVADPGTIAPDPG